jgi:hypothetical protein
MSFCEWSPIHLPHNIKKKPWIKHNKKNKRFYPRLHNWKLSQKKKNWEKVLQILKCE